MRIPQRISAKVVIIALLVPIALGLSLSVRYLPPINEFPPSGSVREGQNWVGEGGWAFARNAVLLLVVVYTVKRLVLTRCSTRGVAVCFFSLLVMLSLLLVMLSLPYIWFLCEPDWFNRFIYRIACWVGGPIAIWFVPSISFLVDLPTHSAVRPLKWYFVRSAIEIVVAIPIWVIFWALFSFWVLDWGWI
jgi:hypothetical protein